MLKLYLDDERETPIGWFRVYTAEECIEVLKSQKVEVLSLDHDLGKCDDCLGDGMGLGEKTYCPHIKSGYEVIKWLENEVATNRFAPPDFIAIHSGNSVGRKVMEQGIESIYRLYEANKNK